MNMPGRGWKAQAHRFGFQNQETDEEFWGGAVSYKYRIHDPRVGRFFSVDPLAPEYPWNSVYAFSENRVIDSRELEGLERINSTTHIVQEGDCFECIDEEYGYSIGTTEANNPGVDPLKLQVGYPLSTPETPFAPEYGFVEDPEGNWIDYANPIEFGYTQDNTGTWNPPSIPLESLTVGQIIWNSPQMRELIPDYLTIEGSYLMSSGVYGEEEFVLTILLRGKDPGVYFNTTSGFGIVSSASFSGSASFGLGHFLGYPSRFSSKNLAGWHSSLSVGLSAQPGIGGGISATGVIGVNENLKPISSTLKLSISGGIGIEAPVNVSGGLGHAFRLIRLTGFNK